MRASIVTERRKNRTMAPWRRILVLALAASIGCSGGGGRPADEAATRAAFEAASTALHDGLRANDLERFLAHVANDVVMMPPGEVPIRGKEAVRAWMTMFLSQYRTSSLVLADREVIVGVGTVVEVGTFEWGLTAVDGGRPVLDRGSYMQVWRRQPDGNWHFAREIWNSSAPQAPPPGP